MAKNQQKPSVDSKEIVNLPIELSPILSDPEISDEKKTKIIHAFLSLKVEKSSFSGPLPHPDILQKYNNVLSGGAERIITMAEKQSAHRIAIEEYTIKEQLTQSKLGQIFGFILGVFGFSLATALAILGHDAIAGIFGTTTIIGLATVFVLGRKSQTKETSIKKPQ